MVCRNLTFDVFFFFRKSGGNTNKRGGETMQRGKYKYIEADKQLLGKTACSLDSMIVRYFRGSQPQGRDPNKGSEGISKGRQWILQKKKC